MVDEVINYLKPNKSKTYLDATFGQGGYSRKILDASDCNVIAFDRDNQSEKYSVELKKSLWGVKIDRMEGLVGIGVTLEPYAKGVKKKYNVEEAYTLECKKRGLSKF